MATPDRPEPGIGYIEQVYKRYSSLFDRVYKRRRVTGLAGYEAREDRVKGRLVSVTDVDLADFQNFKFSNFPKSCFDTANWHTRKINVELTERGVTVEKHGSGSATSLDLSLSPRSIQARMMVVLPNTVTSYSDPLAGQDPIDRSWSATELIRATFRVVNSRYSGPR